MRKQFVDDAYNGLFSGRWAIYRWSLICLLMWLIALMCLYRGLDVLGYQFLFGAIFPSAIAFDMWDARLTGKSAGRLKRFIQRVF